MTMRLFNYFRSSASFRVRIALALKNIAYEYVPVHLVRGWLDPLTGMNGGEQFGAAYQAQNPMAQLPTLELTLDGKTHLVSQSIAIMELLEELYPEPSIFPRGKSANDAPRGKSANDAPRDAFLRARTRELAEIINSGIQPHQNLAPMKRIDALQAGAGKANAQHYNRLGLAAYEERVKETAGKFSVGDAPSMADICLYPQLITARRFEIDLAPYPTLLAIEAACREVPAFIAAAPDKQPDFEA